MKKLLALIICFLIIGASYNTTAETVSKKQTKEQIAQNSAKEKFLEGAKDVIKTYKKLQYKIESGMNYTDYRRAIADAHSEFKMFIDSPAAQYKDEKYSKFSSIITADLQYGFAAETWSFMISNAGNYGFDQSLKDQAKRDMQENWRNAAASVADAEECLSQP